MLLLHGNLLRIALPELVRPINHLVNDRVVVAHQIVAQLTCALHRNGLLIFIPVEFHFVASLFAMILKHVFELVLIQINDFSFLALLLLLLVLLLFVPEFFEALLDFLLFLVGLYFFYLALVVVVLDFFEVFL